MLEIDLNVPEIDLNVPEIDLNVPEIDLNVPEIDLSECEQLVKANLDRSQIDSSWNKLTSIFLNNFENKEKRLKKR